MRHGPKYNKKALEMMVIIIFEAVGLYNNWLPDEQIYHC